MLRVSGGLFRGRVLKVPRSGVRPTKDMVRQALFSAIGESIAGKRVADLFAGSGAIGLDALSRGAGEVAWIESHPKVFEYLQQNVAAMAGAEVASRCCHRQDALIWLRRAHDTRGFDLIYADPPYDPGNELLWGEALLNALSESKLLNSNTLVVLEQHVDQPVIAKSPWHVIKEARYGETRLVYYRRNKHFADKEASS